MSDYYEKSVRESPWQTWIINFATSRGWLVQKLVSQSANGWPDLYLLRKGRTVLIEAKRPKGNLSANQIIRHREIKKHGGEVYCFDRNDKNAVIAILH